MDAINKNAEDLSSFIRENRSNEANFDTLYAKLIELSNSESKNSLVNFEDIMAKAETYKQAKEYTGTAWPEFEKFVSAFEKAVMGTT